MSIGKRVTLSFESLFDTDDDRKFFLVEFFVHPVFAESMKQKPVTQVTTEVKQLLYVMTGDHFRESRNPKGPVSELWNIHT